MATEIGDYALIGDCETAALVDKAGSIDWLCWPRFDSEACFAALLGGPENGRWQLVPEGEVMKVERAYLGNTLILETRFETATSAVRIIDFMPVRGTNSDIVRIVEGVRGRTVMRMDLCIRFDYGRIVPWAERTDDRTLRLVAGPHAVFLRTPAPHHGEDYTTVSRFEVDKGERVPFVLTYGLSHEEMPQPVDPDEALDETRTYWASWANNCVYQGPHQDAVMRSLITVKALTYRPTGGIVAAPTTSLPEFIGGSRNWDYRFCWLRDATFTLLSLMRAGFREEAAAWRSWLLRAVAGMPSQTQPLYGVAGESRMDEQELPWLKGFAGSLPVRTGNAAYKQFQLDVFGEVIGALHHARTTGLDPSEVGWELQRALINEVCRVWEQPDRGIWEVRGPKRHFTHSKVMAWVAVDRGILTVEQSGRSGEVDQWRKVRARIHADVLQHGVDHERGVFVQAYGLSELDAANLMIPLVGFIPPDDPLVRNTVEAIERELTEDGLVLRYRTHATEDGLPPGEGVFLACSFWLADNYLLLDRRADAERLFDRLVGLTNDVGLLAEEYDTRTGKQLGNFPQALSHLALVDTAFNLAEPQSMLPLSRSPFLS